uniref:Uncharacterized protein n=1 Tax=Arundo donax TaxID=35708 RepID=A0A0A9CJ30_ARUDO
MTNCGHHEGKESGFHN